MNNMNNASSCDITSTLLYCNYWWYSNPSFFIGQVLLTTDVWSSLWDVFYVTLVLPYWYVGTHGPLLVHMGACLGVIHILLD